MFLEQITECIESAKNNGCIILLAEYRPDIAKMIADHLQFEFYDYREKEMLPLGWDAGDIKLDQLDACLTEKSSISPIIAFNIEALLALKPEIERREWFTRFIEHPWPDKIVLPVTIYIDDVLESSQDTCNLLTMTLPEQSLINRLVN